MGELGLACSIIQEDVADGRKNIQRIRRVDNRESYTLSGEGNRAVPVAPCHSIATSFCFDQ